MNEATIALTVMSGLILIIFLGFLIWGIKSGQFKNIEESKYRMLQNDLKSEECEKHTYPESEKSSDRSKI